MKRSFIISYFLLYSLASFGQATITVYNHSSTNIDSFVIDGYKRLNLGGLEHGKKKSFFIKGEQANFHSIAPFKINIFSGGHQFSKQWEKINFVTPLYTYVDTLYFFEHGIRRIDQPFLKPTIFELSIFNATSRNFDTVFCEHNEIKKITELSPRRRLIAFDYSKVDSTTEIKLKLGDTTFLAKLNFHPFYNWADTLNHILIKNETLFTGDHSTESPLEFILDLNITNTSPDSVQVLSKHLIKTYDWPDAGYFYTKRYVFDYEKIKSEPGIELKVGSVKHFIQFNKFDLAFGFRTAFLSYNKLW